jgi:hypothetical protein
MTFRLYAEDPGPRQGRRSPCLTPAPLLRPDDYFFAVDLAFVCSTLTAVAMWLVPFSW